MHPATAPVTPGVVQPPPAAGDQAVEAAAVLFGPGVLKADGAAPEATLEIVDRQTSERIELSALRDPLDRLASTTGGQVFTDVEANALIPLLKSRTHETVKTEEFPLWDRPWALVLFFTVLSVEWVVRKRAGLP